MALKFTQTVLPSLTVTNLSFSINSAVSTSPLPTALLLGWYASTPEHLDKYAQFYNSLGYNTVSLTLPHPAIFGTNTLKRQRQIALELESHFTDPATPFPSLTTTIAVAFSNGGYFGLLSITSENCPTLFPTITNIIADSAPCALYASAGARAISYGISGRDATRNLLTFAITPLFYVAGAVQYVFNVGEDHAGFFQRCRDYPFQGQELYLYSDGDKLCDIPALTQLIEARKEKCQVTANNFGSTQHVQHMRESQAAYESLVKKFLNSKSKL